MRQKGFFKAWGVALLCLCCLSAGTALHAQGSRQSDSLELVAFYNATGGANWSNKTNWLTSNPMNTWYGISLINGRVSSIYLNANQLTGSIPNLNLPNLQYLKLHFNQLIGSIPNFNLPNLIWLELASNQLTGTIPNFNLPNLQNLYLDWNQLTGSIPNFNLPNLGWLALSSNQLTGCIPTGIKINCPSIGANNGGITNNPNLVTQSWSSYWNNNVGACQPILQNAPVSITTAQCGSRDYRLPSGRTVNAVGVYADTASGRVRDTIYSVNLIADTSCRCLDSIQLVSLYTATNGANWTNKTNWLSTNPIHTWHGVHTTAIGCVDSIFLYNNRLNGNLPNLNLPYLQTLQLEKNQLNGNIPNFNLPNLQLLVLSENQLSNSIPNFNLPRLQKLYLSANQLNGSLPNFNLPQLQHMYLWGNQLNGSIPNFNLPNLQILHLSNNQLNGNIPNFNLPNLQSLLLSFNGLSGNLPSLAQCTSLQTVYIANNRFTFAGLPTLVSRNWTTFNYAPQDSIGRDTLITAYRASTAMLVVPMPHEAGNKYSWYKGTAFINDTTARSQFPLYRLHPADAGTYYCKVTNERAPQLTLQSRPIRLNVISPAVVNGGTRTEVICGARDYRLPSGRIVNYVGTHRDTIVHLDATIDTAYTIQLRSDSSCHCQDSIALAGMYHTSGGFPQNWDLNQPLRNWAGLTLNAAGCVTSWIDARPDSVKCMTLGSSDTLRPDFGIWELVNAPKKWYRNGSWVATYNGNPLSINDFWQDRDSGRYVCRTDLVAGQFSLIPTLRSVITRAYQVRLCCTTVVVESERTVRVGACVSWGGINRCSTGVYTYTTTNPLTTCDTLHKLNLQVIPCQLNVELAQTGNELHANAESTYPIVNYQWSNQVQGLNYNAIAISIAGNYTVTVTNSLGCKDTATIAATFRPIARFQIPETNLVCGSAVKIPIKLQQRLQNGIAYTIHIKFDTTKVRPDPTFYPADHRFLTGTDTGYYYRTIYRDSLTINFGVTRTGNTINGALNDILLQTSWLAASQLNNGQARFEVTIVESIANIGGYNKYYLSPNTNLEGNTTIMFTVLNMLQTNRSDFHTNSSNTNPTLIKTGERNAMSFAAQVTTTGIQPPLRLSGNELGFYRLAQPVRGITGNAINNTSAYLLHQYSSRRLSFNNLQKLAADVDGDGYIAPADLSLILSRMYEVTSGFVQNNSSLHPNTVRAWKFFPKSYLTRPDFNATVMRDSLIPKIDTIFTIPEAYRNRCDTMQMDITAVMLGKLDTTYNGQAHMRSNASLMIDLRTPASQILSTFRRVPVYLNNGVIKGLDIQITNYNPAIQIVQVEFAHGGNLQGNSAIFRNTRECYFGYFALDLNGFQTTEPICYVWMNVPRGYCLKSSDLGIVGGSLNNADLNTTFEQTPCSTYAVTETDTELLDVNISTPRIQRDGGNTTTFNRTTRLMNAIEIRIFPNPSKDVFNIVSNDVLGKVEVYNAIGKLVKTMETVENQFQLDMTDFADGMYMVRIGEKSYKLIKK